MSRLPAKRTTHNDRPSRFSARAADMQDRTALDIFRHELGAQYLAQIDRIDAQALHDVLRCSLDEELNLLDYGLQKANGSAAKAELVARKVTIQSDYNNARIARRFRGQ